MQEAAALQTFFAATWEDLCLQTLATAAAAKSLAQHDFAAAKSLAYHGLGNSAEAHVDLETTEDQEFAPLWDSRKRCRARKTASVVGLEKHLEE